MHPDAARIGSAPRFQCSSASRKFLNRCRSSTVCSSAGVSVLFSEPKIPQWIVIKQWGNAYFDVSVLFSEPKIPQSGFLRAASCPGRVSVLFSEPKIPQFTSVCAASYSFVFCFSALQRAENSSICPRPQSSDAGEYDVSVLFSEPKIPQLKTRGKTTANRRMFQCSSASRKFLNSTARRFRQTPDYVSVLFSEPKIPQRAARLKGED